MRFLNRLRIWKDLRRLETRVREEPSPSTFVDLGQVYINLGMIEETLAAAEEGLRLFPTSNELKNLQKFAKRKQLDGRVKDLRQRLNKEPTPRLFRDLAMLYVEMGDSGAVQATCEEAIRRFPQDVTAYTVLARARLVNYYRDLTSRDGIEAVRMLQEVVEIDPTHAPAYRMLADVLYRSGAVATAAEQLECLLLLTPDDPEVAAALAEVARQPEQRVEDLDVLFHAVECAGRLANGPLIRELPGGSDGSDELADIREALAQIADLPGVTKACYIKNTKALVKGDIKDGKDPFLRLARVVAKAAQRATRRMDIGSFSKAALDGEFGQICVCCFGDVIAAVLCSAESDTNQVLSELQELVAGSLCEASA